jgi:tetratricopeptide (TPR) repeat protein
MKLALQLALLVGASTWTLTAQAQDANLSRAWTSAVLESEHLRTDDRSARNFELVELIERDPSHPLAELGLRMVRESANADRMELFARCLKLDAARLTPAAAAELELLRLRYEVLRASTGGPAPTPSTHYLQPAFVLGPLPDVYDAARRAELLNNPRYNAEHRGYPGQKERWRPCSTAALDVFVDPDELVGAEYGWGGLAFGFEAPSGGPAWLEVDVTGDAGPRLTTTRGAQPGGALAQIDDPSLRVKLNDGAPQDLDFLELERPRCVRLPVVLLSGGNEVLVVANFGARLRLSLRVLGADGRPLSGLKQLRTLPTPGTPVMAEPPQSFPQDALAWLEMHNTGSASSLALLGAAHLWLGESVRGSNLLERAVALDPKSVGARLWAAEYFNGENYAPQSWSRGKARALFDELLAEDAQNLRAAGSLLETLGAEDREEEALKMVAAAAEAAPQSPTEALQRAYLYTRLELDVPAERARQQAAERAGDSPQVVNAIAQHWTRWGFERRALQTREAALDTNGAAPGELTSLAEAAAELGDAQAALNRHRRAAALGDADAKSALLQHLLQLKQFDAAEAVARELAELGPRNLYYRTALADIALERGDRAAEREHLLAALKLAPSDRDLRSRLVDLGWSDPAEAFFKRWEVDAQKELASFDPARWNDHVVRAVDAAAVYVFDDGVWEQVNHSRAVARDLEGCEELGSQSEQEETLRIFTLKGATGELFEPALVNGEYVMPVLEPGDTVEVVWRDTGSYDREGRIVLGSWTFASQTEPFYLSRYVISAPKHLELELVQRNFNGRHEVLDEGERVTHVFELREVDRVVPELGAPPADWTLPWVQFGTRRSRASMAEQARSELIASLRATPRLEEAAAKALEGVEGQTNQAQALHRFVSEALDKRNDSLSSATAALLQREGNPALLYAALLRIAGIDHDLVWSRGVDPRADPEPQPAFPDLGRWLGRMLVVVRPDDGEEAWCNLSVETMPYGACLNDSPRAEALSALTGEFVNTPDVPLDERAGELSRLALVLAPDRSAQIELDFELTGNMGYSWKDGLREAPSAALKQLATRIATTVVRGVEVESHEWRGLADEAPTALHVKGKHKRYLDQQKGELTCRLPFPQMQMGGAAGGEGERKQPYFFAQTAVRRWSARIELDPKLKLAQGVEAFDLRCAGASFVQTVRPDGEHAFVVERALRIEPFLLPPEQFGEWAAFCKKLDEVDRAKLRIEVLE